MRQAASFCAVFLMTTIPLAAQTIVVNGDFDDDLIGWSSSSGSDIYHEWNPMDADADPDSGSVLIDNVSIEGSNGVTLEQCLPAVAGHSYLFGGKVRVPSGPGQSLSNNAMISLFWKSDHQCGASVGGPITLHPTPNAFDMWFSRASSTVVAPEGARSVLVRALVTKFPAGGSFSAQFDGLYLIPQDELFANDFEM